MRAYSDLHSASLRPEFKLATRKVSRYTRKTTLTAVGNSGLGEGVRTQQLLSQSQPQPKALCHTSQFTSLCRGVFISYSLSVSCEICFKQCLCFSSRSVGFCPMILKAGAGVETLKGRQGKGSWCILIIPALER